MAVEITPERVSAAAARLHEGGWRFSARQLYYGVCADVETAPTRVGSGEVGLGVLLILVGAITGQRLVLAVLGLIGLLVLIVGVVTHLQEGRPLPVARLLTRSYPDFAAAFLGDGQRFAGLISSAAQPGPGGGGRLVVCDRAETASIVEANREHLGDVDVTTADPLPHDLQGRRLITLHDCDPAGCALTADLRDRGADVVDAGINPAELLGRRLQLIEGAAARLPRDLSGHLDDVQTEWLRSGRRLECATQTPEQIVQRVQAALAAG